MTADLFNIDPAKNDKPPPNGSPQGGLPLKRVSATLRVMMAGIADCWTAIKALKGMANQDPGNVNITGGIIDTGVTIKANISGVADDCNKAFGHTVQQIYDLMYPVGEGRLFFNAAQPPIWPNIVASWQLVSTGRYLRTSDPLEAGNTGGDVSVATGTAGAHNHGGVTGDTAAAVTLNYPLGSDSRGNGFPFGSQQNATATEAVHHHSIPNAPDHAHSVQLTPLFVDVAMYRRIS